MEPSWPEIADAFYRFLVTHGRTVDTATTYAAHLRTFWTWCMKRELSPALVAPTAVELYLAEQLTALSRSTAHVRLSAVKAFYRWLISLGQRTDDPTLGLTVQKDRRLPRPPLDVAAVRRLVGACENEEQRLLFLLGFATGVRISELVGIRRQDIYSDKGLLLVRGKGHKERWVAPRQELIVRLLSYTGERRRPFELTREQGRRLMQRIAAKAGVEGFYPHPMRGTFADNFLAATHDLEAAQALLGHADPGV